MRPVAYVPLNIADFRDRVRDFDGDDAGLAAWIRNFSRALARFDNSEEFASVCLGMVESARAELARRKQESRKKAAETAPEKKPARPAQPKPQPKPQPKKSFYGEFANVALSDEESAKLQAKLGPARFERGVEVLGAWKVNNPAKAARIKSDYACFTSWVIKRLDEEKAADAKGPKAFAASERDRMADIVRNEFPDVIEEFGL